jgi:hypothetical protein
MTTLSAYLSTTVLSIAWMPLDGLIQEWGAFGEEQASTALALHAVGMAFCALARETTARHTRSQGHTRFIVHGIGHRQKGW